MATNKRRTPRQDKQDPAYLERVRAEIRGWEASKPGYISHIADFVLDSVEQVSARMISPRMRASLEKNIAAALVELQTMAKDSFDAKGTRALVGLQKPKGLEAMDLAAQHYWDRHLAYAAVEGGATGVAGLAGLAIDVPSLIGLALRAIYQIGTCYGYDVADALEREYALQVLRLGSSGNVQVKVKFSVSLNELEAILRERTWKRLTEEEARRQINRMSLLLALRQLAKSLALQLTRRKALQMIPVTGALVGAGFNAQFLNDVCRSAYMSYRRRKLADLEF